MKPVNTNSSPSGLRITDMRFVDIDGAPKRCTLIKIMTNQGLTGYGEVRDASSKLYAQMLKSRILGENPCNVDKIFRKIKQFGWHSRPEKLTGFPSTSFWAVNSGMRCGCTATRMWTADTPEGIWDVR